MYLEFPTPVDSYEKIKLSVSVLTAQIMFLLLTIDNIPLTSLAVPLLGKLIIFNMILVVLSIMCTVFVLNIYCRQPHSHKMPKWILKIMYGHGAFQF